MEDEDNYLHDKLKSLHSQLKAKASEEHTECKVIWQGPYLGGTLQLWLSPDPSVAIFKLDFPDGTYQGACQLNLAKLGVSSAAECVDRLLLAVRGFYEKALMEQATNENPTFH